GKIETILVVVDREQGGRENLEEMGYRVKSVTTISDLIGALRATGTLSHETADEIKDTLKVNPRVKPA
ncbi:MAG: orotidine 5'-phosphate decarboxylase, partial [Nitrososphaeria archaeon]|nr:orotidine 5'-phosphate decarboxylase [Nitrososphaeria archaeon]